MTKPITVIHDTIIIRDTIYQTITATKLDKAEVYKDILTNQSSTNNLIFLVFFGLLTLFIGASFLYNITVAKSQIIKQTNKIFEKEKIALIEHIKKDFYKELNSVKGENARLFAISNAGETAQNLAGSIYWWSLCIKYYNLSERENAIRNSIIHTTETLNRSLANRIHVKTRLLELYPDIQSQFYEIINDLPLILLVEKQRLKELFDQIIE